MVLGLGWFGMVLGLQSNAGSQCRIIKGQQLYRDTFINSSIPVQHTWRVRGVMRRCILGARKRCLVLPSFKGRGRLMTNCLTSSCLVRLNSLRILDARLGPSRRGMVLSVSPGISCNETSCKSYKCHTC